MSGMPSCRHMEYKGNYKLYSENLSKIFESSGKMKSGDEIYSTDKSEMFSPGNIKIVESESELSSLKGKNE